MNVNKPAGKKLTVTLSKKRSEAAAVSVDDNLETTWNVLAEFIAGVHALRATRYSLQELYAAVESLVLLKQGSTLYDRLINTCRNNIQQLIDQIAASPSDSQVCLRATQSAWTTHCSQMIMIRNVFLYLDRTYVRDAGIKSIWDVGLQVFSDCVRNTGDVLQRIIVAMVSAITLERKGEHTDRPMLTTLSRMLVLLRLYSPNFEAALLTSTEEFFAIESAGKIATLDVPQYLIHAEKRLSEEKERVLTVLDPQTLRPLIHIAEQQLLSRHVATVLEKGFAAMVDQLRLEDAKRLYSLFARVNALEDTRKRFMDIIKAKAGSITAEQTEEKDKTIVEDLLQFKADMDNMIAHAFSGNETFGAALRNALEFAINCRDNRPAELLAKHVDTLMRGGTKAAKVSTEEEMNGVFDRIIALFRCVHSKDIFEAFYKKDLGRRLLLDKSASSDLESHFVSKLKAECGAAYTSKMEGMFKDVALSQELMSQFKASKHSKSLPFDTTVSVLTSSYWPQYTPSTPTIPDDFSAAVNAFHEFYENKYSKFRRLQWQHQLGRCVLQANFPMGKKELEVSFHQARVLLMFNDIDSATVADIRSQTGLDEGETKATLVSLALGKVKVLTKKVADKDLSDTAVFSYNAAFKDVLYRLKINTAQIKETKVEVEATHHKVQEDRQYQTDAAIVRIMKSRKVLQHQQLLAEVFAHLRFPVQAQDVKKRIESLIDRDYLERDATDPSSYHYLA